MYGDVYLAIDAMHYLKEGYCLKIIGYGSIADINFLREYISTQGLGDKVFYEGLLSGDEFSNYLSRCSIGLNPRVLENTISDYTFPSKVLTYLSHGLSVVSTNINCIKESKVSTAICFSEDSTPQAFSQAIVEVDLSKKAEDVLNVLDKEFKSDLKRLLSNDSNR